MQSRLPNHISVSLATSPRGGGSLAPPSSHGWRPLPPPLLPPREQPSLAPSDAEASPHRALLSWRAARGRRSWRGRPSPSCSSTCPPAHRPWRRHPGVVGRPQVQRDEDGAARPAFPPLLLPQQFF